MTCSCHGEPAFWHADPRHRRGGYWRCPVRKREVAEARSGEKNLRARERYDSDPIYRIEKNLHDHARRRKQTIERRRAVHVSEQGSM